MKGIYKLTGINISALYPSAYTCSHFPYYCTKIYSSDKKAEQM